MNTKTFKNILRGTALCLALGATQQAAAYTTWSCLGEKMKWDTYNPTMRLSQVSFQNSAWRSSMDSALDRANQNPSKFRFYRSYNDTSVGTGNGQNEAWFSTDQNLLGGAPAVALLRWDCVDYWIFGKDVEITEADIVFDPNVPYTTSMNKDVLWSHGGSLRPFQTTAIHELGHAAGLAHTNNTYNIMGQDWDHIHANGSTARAYLGEDAANGMVYLYNTANAFMEDVAVSQFKRTGASGEYSVHDNTVLRTTSGGAVSSFISNGERVYRVNRGQTYRLELTFENNGKTYQSEDLGLYISTNNLISTFDTLIRTSTVSLGRNTVYTASYNVTIPANTPRGTDRWLGAIVDRDGSLAESTEANNATYLPIRIN